MVAYNRICYVQLGGGQPFSYYKDNGFQNIKWETIEGLDVRFNIKFFSDSAEGTANISILGLSFSRILQLASWAGEATAYSKCWFIRVYAGYGVSRNDVDMIFEGQIINAMPTSPPDVWLNIEARTHYGNRTEYFTVDFMKLNHLSKRTATIRKALSLLCESLNAAHNLTDDMIRTLSSDMQKVLSYGTTALPVFPSTSQYSDVVKSIKAICKNNNLTFRRIFQSNGFPKYEFYPRLMPDDWEPGTLLEISAKTGMIGIPQMRYEGIVVKSLLSNAHKDMLLGYFKVYSRFAMPGMYGQNQGLTSLETKNPFECIYRVLSITYTGHLRGKEWYVSYDGTRFIHYSDVVDPANRGSQK